MADLFALNCTHLPYMLNLWSCGFQRMALLRASGWNFFFYSALLIYLQISDSFRKFGMGDSDTSLFVVIINDKDDTVLGEIKKRIRGTELPVEECANLADTELIKKVWSAAWAAGKPSLNFMSSQKQGSLWGEIFFFC